MDEELMRLNGLTEYDYKNLAQRVAELQATADDALINSEYATIIAELALEV